MCELFTIAAALAFTALFFRARKSGAPHRALGATALTFWGAALMWSVDCIHSLAEGEGLLDLSAGDAALGVLVLCCGLVLHAALLIRFKEVPAQRRSA